MDRSCLGSAFGLVFRSQLGNGLDVLDALRVLRLLGGSGGFRLCSLLLCLLLGSFGALSHVLAGSLHESSLAALQPRHAPAELLRREQALVLGLLKIVERLVRSEVVGDTGLSSAFDHVELARCFLLDGGFCAADISRFSGFLGSFLLCREFLLGLDLLHSLLHFSAALLNGPQDGVVGKCFLCASCASRADTASGAERGQQQRHAKPALGTVLGDGSDVVWLKAVATADHFLTDVLDRFRRGVTCNADAGALEYFLDSGSRIRLHHRYCLQYASAEGVEYGFSAALDQTDLGAVRRGLFFGQALLQTLLVCLVAGSKTEVRTGASEGRSWAERGHRHGRSRATDASRALGQRACHNTFAYRVGVVFRLQFVGASDHVPAEAVARSAPGTDGLQGVASEAARVYGEAADKLSAQLLGIFRPRTVVVACTAGAVLNVTKRRGARQASVAAYAADRLRPGQAPCHGAARSLIGHLLLLTRNLVRRAWRAWRAWRSSPRPWPPPARHTARGLRAQSSPTRQCRQACDGVAM